MKRTTRRRRRALAVSLGLLVAVTVLPAPAVADRDRPSDIYDAFDDIRQVTAKYHDLDAAIADGYELGYNGIITGCIAHPTDGAMGYHYFRADLIDDPAVNALQPEGLVYAPDRHGQLHLAAVEWVVPGPVPPDPSLTPPSVLGMDLHVLNPALGWYIQHAWVWQHNPAGIFEDWNPKVTCP